MNAPIPLFSATLANAGIDFNKPVKRVLDSHWYVMGSEVAAFEREFANYCGAGHCIGLGNGTDALELGLRAVGVGAGDKVVMAANAGFYGSTAAHLIGAAPYYVDIDPVTQTLGVEGLAAALQENAPKAIIVTHLYGQLADIEAICQLASAHGVPVIEDCAQAHGAMRGGKRAGTFATLASFSFYPTKNLGALGDGGAIVTNDEQIASRVAQLRQYGWGAKYSVDIQHGRNSRLDELQAAVLREKLPHLDNWNARRREIAAQYNQGFSDSGAICPNSLGEDYVAHLYVLRVSDREAFREHMKQQGIATDVHYPIPDYRQNAYAGTQPASALPHTERACASVVSLPCYPGITDEDIARVMGAAKEYFAKAGAESC